MESVSDSISELTLEEVKAIIEKKAPKKKARKKTAKKKVTKKK